MTTTDHCTTHHAERPALPARMAKLVSNLWRAFRNRGAFQRLGEMSDAELADVGLTRADLRTASDPRFGPDPTARLGAMAGERIRQMEALARQVN
jgi:uncharacterized protein YjiS (DUF1127 family)